MKQVSFLEHIVFWRGILVDHSKIEAIINWPWPVNVHEIQSFLGLVGYSRRFVEGFSMLADPLTTLTRKDVKYHWSTMRRAFKY